MAGYLVGLDINDVASETFSGNASTTAFTLAAAGTTNSTGVYILGVHQVPSTDYSVSGTTLTFTTAPPTGTNNISVVYTKPAIVNTPADGTITTAKLSGALVTPGTLDLNGQELILDANANTSITADTDDQIDIKIAGADDFQFSANAFNVLSGSTLTIDSGATIVNSGTATNFGADTQSAYTGVLETNANFVDQVIFGPAVDGTSWDGLWSSASLFSSLMLATVEDPGSAAQVNIWDLTEQSSGTISTTPLGTVNISGAATPTSIAASMGYIIVGHEDGITIIDPHDGSWAERTVGWPKSLSTSTKPALGSNDVDDVCATILRMAPIDPRTGGSMPTFRVSSDSTTNAIMANDGVPHNAEVTSTHTAEWNGTTGVVRESNNSVRMCSAWRLVGKGDNGDEIIHPSGSTDGLHSIADEAKNCFAAGPSGTGTMFAIGGASGLDLADMNVLINGGFDGMIAHVDRTYNTGYMVGKIRGAWLANSNTVDRSWKANTLTNNGTVPTGAVESGAELNFYGPFSTSNYLARASDADWDVIGTGSFYMSIWFKCSGNSASETFMGFGNSGRSVECYTGLLASGIIDCQINGATATAELVTSATFDDDAWHKIDMVNVSSTERYLYVDGILEASNTTDSGSVSDDGNMPFGVGILHNGSSNPCTTTLLSLARLSATGPSATQVRQAYEAEKGMFVANAECLLQSGSTDAVLDVCVDPLSQKILVTQTDAITIFDGLVVDSKPTVNSGASEKGKLWGALRAEQNSANAYVTAPAVDQRQVNEMVRGVVLDPIKGPDLGKAKVWCVFDQAANRIEVSHNVRSITLSATGITEIKFAIPFKDPAWATNDKPQYAIVLGICPNAATDYVWYNVNTRNSIKIYSVNASGSAVSNAQGISVAIFGELDNE